MERMITPEERIRRAEEIYHQRKIQNAGVRVTQKAVNTGKTIDYSLVKKMLLQILICLVIYFIYYLISNTNYLFSEDVLKKTKEILSYDVNFEQIYEQGIGYWDQIKQQWMPKEGEKEEEKEEKKEEDKEKEDSKNPVTEENIGGAVEEIIPPEEEEPQQTENLSQMQLDANAIKEKYQFIYPIEGTITSRFGLRNPTTPTVPKNHTGIDIANTTGTVIKAALDGVVEVASSEGDYGNHLKIKLDDVEIIYAHCSKLYKKEGDLIKQGDAIAEVGATGNVTGPHLHFEIRKER